MIADRCERGVSARCPDDAGSRPLRRGRKVAAIRGTTRGAVPSKRAKAADPLHRRCLHPVSDALNASQPGGDALAVLRDACQRYRRRSADRSGHRRRARLREARAGPRIAAKPPHGVGDQGGDRAQQAAHARPGRGDGQLVARARRRAAPRARHRGRGDEGRTRLLDDRRRRRQARADDDVRYRSRDDRGRRHAAFANDGAPRLRNRRADRHHRRAARPALQHQLVGARAALALDHLRSARDQSAHDRRRLPRLTRSAGPVLAARPRPADRVREPSRARDRERAPFRRAARASHRDQPPGTGPGPRAGIDHERRDHRRRPRQDREASTTPRRKRSASKARR